VSAVSALSTAQAAVTFQQRDYPVKKKPSTVAVADLNGDTFLDLAIANKTGFSILYGEPGGGFGDKTDYATSETPIGLTAGDVNGDGKPDIVVTNWNAASISVFLNQGE
jgi:hypothetical protein